MKKSLIQWLGLLGVVGLLSYTAAVLFAPLAYPGYRWTAQAVSDLSASSAPSRILWGQLAALYGPCSLVCGTLACVYVAGKLTKPMRLGIYLFAIMGWVSVGYGIFPLSEAGFAGAFQDTMHVVVTVFVILLSVVSLALLMIGGFKDRRYLSLAVFAAAALFFMMLGGIGSGAFTKYFGVFERFSVFSAAAFHAVIGIYLFLGFPERGQRQRLKSGENEAT